MITFPNAKINLGLNVLNKRTDGYHNISSLFLPIPLKDALEIIPCSGATQFSSSGIDLGCKDEDNLVLKAYYLLAQAYHLPAVKIHLHKHIPFGAGLGGGSADAAFALKMLNDMFGLQLSEKVLESYAVNLGADCAFFIKNRAALAQGIGDELSDYPIELQGYSLLLVKPDVHVSTPDAYRFVKPQIPNLSLGDVLQLPIELWSLHLKNDFETSVFAQYPSLALIKQNLYESGAVYAAMSGSGSSIFGIFKQKPKLKPIFAKHFSFESRF